MSELSYEELKTKFAELQKKLPEAGVETTGTLPEQASLAVTLKGTATPPEPVNTVVLVGRLNTGG